MRRLIPALILSSCASTTLYDAGRPICRIEGDAKGLHYLRKPDGTVEIRADTLTHSTATAAQGRAAAGKITAGASLVSAGAAALLAK